MQILKEIWGNLGIIGLGILIWIAYFVWQEMKRAAASAEKSNQEFRARTEVMPLEDRDDLGVEASWPISPPRK